MGNAGLVAGNPRFLRRLSVLESPSHRTMGIFQSKKKVKVAVVGLDNSGKSTILNKLKPKQATINEVTPTVGFSTEEFEHGSARFKAWDFSGQSRYRELWQHYYAESKGIIFVVDSTDKIRMVIRVKWEESEFATAGMISDPIARCWNPRFVCSYPTTFDGHRVTHHCSYQNNIRRNHYLQFTRADIDNETAVCGERGA